MAQVEALRSRESYQMSRNRDRRPPAVAPESWVRLLPEGLATCRTIAMASRPHAGAIPSREDARRRIVVDCRVDSQGAGAPAAACHSAGLSGERGRQLGGAREFLAYGADPELFMRTRDAQTANNLPPSASRSWHRRIRAAPIAFRASTSRRSRTTGPGLVSASKVRSLTSSGFESSSYESSLGRAWSQLGRGRCRGKRLGDRPRGRRAGGRSSRHIIVAFRASASPPGRRRRRIRRRRCTSRRWSGCPSGRSWAAWRG